MFRKIGNTRNANGTLPYVPGDRSSVPELIPVSGDESIERVPGYHDPGRGRGFQYFVYGIAQHIPGKRSMRTMIVATTV